MNPNREELLFQLALTKPGGERRVFLDRACASDAAHDQPDELLAVPAEGAAPTMKIEFAEEPADEAVGQTLGRCFCRDERLDAYARP